ncbi:MAG: BspA family leucine-rich repeat surface protein [Lachnospiraceae bacterium]|nr:BspA family leucine-rich repeat surface protein [Lachnospiraceae bacterium]
MDLSSFNTSKVKYMFEMFMGCENLKNLDLSSFNTSNVIKINEMFDGCRSLTSLDLRNFNTSKAIDMNNMFSGCESLENLDISSFNTKNVGDMTYMFAFCYNLKCIDLSSFNTKNVWSMDSMFCECTGLESLDLSNFDTSEVREIGDMFMRCDSLTSLDLSSFDLSNLGNYEEDDYEDYEDYAQTYSFGYNNEVFTGCNNLSFIRTPKNCPEEIKLPTGASGTDKWYQALDAQCTTLPISQSTSIDLYKNGYPGDANGTKKAAFISGISINNIVYNGQNARYLGTAVVTDSNKNKITGATLTYSYIGTLADETDYKESAQAPSNAGEYKLLIKAESDDYSGQASYSFRIIPKTVVIRADSLSIDTGVVLPALADLSYTVSGLIGDDKLTVEPKYTYSETNISTASAGRYGIVPSGASAGNNYYIEYEEGTLTVGDPDDDSSFEMDERNGLDLSSLSCTIAPVKAKIYDGSAYEPTVKVTVTENGKKKTLAEGTDYRVLYDGNVNAGTGKVIVRGSGIYKGYKEASFTINPKAVKKLKVVTGGVAGTISADAVNSGSTSLPVYIYDAGKLLTRDKDYTLTYDSVKKGTLTVKVNGVDGSNYTGETKAKIAVYEGASSDKIINPDNVSLKSYTEKYTGKAIKPVVEVNINGEVVSNKNYKVQYQNNKNAGTAYVIVTGKGAYKGKVVTAFEITANTQKLHITNIIKAQTYKGKYVKPSVTVKAGNKKLKKNTDYTVTYKNNLHAGTATVTVTGKGNYTGTASKTFTINPLNVSKISVKGTWKDSDGDNIKDGGALTVTYGKRLLKEGVDYTLEAGEIKKNKIKVTLTAAEGSDFTGSVVKTLKME